MASIPKMRGVERIRVSGLVLVTIAVWLFDWILFIMIRLDTGWLAAPYVLLLPVILLVVGRKKKKGNYRPAYSVTTAVALMLGYLLFCVMALYYNPIFTMTLLWNMNGLASIMVAYWATMRNGSLSELNATVPSA